MKNKLNNIWLGIIAGILGAFIGFYGFALGWSLINDRTVSYFINDVFLNSDLFKDKIITVSILFDVLLFFMAIRLNMINFAKGVLGVVITSLPIIIYFY